MVRERNYSTNQLKKAIESGGVGVIANGPNNSDMCDFLGHLGFDAAFIDFEHGGVSWSELADITIYVIDVAAGEKIPRKGGPGITRSDLLVINKIDLAPRVGASLEVMERDTRRMRDGKPFDDEG